MSEHVVGSVIATVLAAAVLGLVPPTREAVADVTGALVSWLGDDTGAGHWALVVIGGAGLLAGLLLSPLLPIRPLRRPEARAALKDAQAFRDEFLDLMRWLRRLRFGVREGHEQPEDARHQARYEQSRRRLLELHDRVGPELRAWLNGEAEPRYDIEARDRQALEAHYGIDIAAERADAPYTGFFEPPFWDQALDSAQSLGDPWDDARFKREIARRRDALDG